MAPYSPSQAQTMRMPAMAHKRGGLLAQIETDVVDSTVPLSSLLQKCLALGGQAESQKLRDWARWELNGYAGAETVPDHRHFHAVLMAVITNNAGYNAMTQRIGEDVFPPQIRDVIRESVGDIEDAFLPQGIGMLEGLASQGTDMHRLGPPWSSIMADTLNQFNMAPNSRIREVYWSVPNASIRGILVRIRAALAELVAELITLTAQGHNVPDKLAADQAMHLVITGDRPTIHFGDSHAGDTVIHNSGSQYSFGDITGNVAAGSSDFSQTYTAGFDITKVREFAELVTDIVGQLRLEPDQQADLTAAANELHEAIEDPAADKGRMHQAVETVMGYLKLARDTALKKMVIAVGNQAGDELDKVIHRLHP